MENVLYTIVVLLVAVNNVVSGKTFNCEIWKKEYAGPNHEHIHKMIRCGDTGNVTTAAVTVDYNKKEELDTHSKFGQGHYWYVGNIVEDGSAIYGQSEDNPGGRSVIIIDWQGDKNWIGTRHLDERKEASIWLKSSCKDKKIEDCEEITWEIRKEKGGGEWLGVKEGLSISYESGGLRTGYIVAIVLAVIVVVAAGIAGVVYFMKRKGNRRNGRI